MSSERLRILVLEDQPGDARLAVEALREGGFACVPTFAATRAAFESAFAAAGFDAILADYQLPDYTGLEALELVRRTDAFVPFILLSGALGEERAVEALHAGATDYVLKESLARLAPALRRALGERAERERHLATSRALEMSQERLRALSHRLLEVQEQERGRLARELHDDIGQALTALKIQLEGVARIPPQEAPQRIAQCIEMTVHALERVRQLSFSLRPLQLDDLGLVAALRSHLDRQASIGELAPHFEARAVPEHLPGEIQTACFRIAQEAINNVLRHARARNLWLSVRGERGALGLEIRDDGCGFDAEAARRRSAAGASLGLVGMEERVAFAGGTLELRTAVGQGTRLLATFPIEPKTGEPH
jgi:signal transduction histidine kinase